MTTTKVPHPGTFIRTAVLDREGLNVTDAAEALGVSRVTLSTLIHGRAALSGDMALRIEQAFGMPMDTLMLMQASYDIAQTRSRAHTVTVPRYRGDGQKGSR